MIKEYKIEVIKTNIEARQKEIADYEINIFNFEFMANETEDASEKEAILNVVNDNHVQMSKIVLVLKALNAQLELLSR